MKTAFSNLSALAGAYLPKGFKDGLLKMAYQSDLQAQEIAAIREELGRLAAIIHPQS